MIKAWNDVKSFVTIIMTILSAVIYFLMQVFIKDLNNIEIPIVYIAGLLGNIYKYTSPSGKCYIGQTIKENIRKSQHK